MTALSSAQASLYAQMALAGVRREYPNMLAHVLEGPEDAQTPRALHPAFYGCYDWHSSVHSHWMLARLLRQADLPEAAAIRELLLEHLTAENMEAEAAYFARPSTQSFERPYGWGWLLKLAAELAAAADPEIATCAERMKPLVETIVQRFLGFLPKQTYPIRLGTHTNTAFGMVLAFDFARATGHAELESLLRQRARDYYGADRDYPAHLEPSGADFLSPSLCEADLMRRVLEVDEFGDWWSAFLPQLPPRLLTPATVSDRHDPQIVHLDGLNLSRAWCLCGITQSLPDRHPQKDVLAKASEDHAQAGVAQISSGDYLGEHWLASFAVYLLTDAGAHH